MGCGGSCGGDRFEACPPGGRNSGGAICVCSHVGGDMAEDGPVILPGNCLPSHGLPPGCSIPHYILLPDL